LVDPENVYPYGTGTEARVVYATKRIDQAIAVLEGRM
jgi:hypothetical protein